MSQMRRVIDIHEAKKWDKTVFDKKNGTNNVFEASHKLVIGLGLGNDSYYAWEVVENPTGEEEGYGYLTNEEVALLNDFVIWQGGAMGEIVLIGHNW